MYDDDNDDDDDDDGDVSVGDDAGDGCGVAGGNDVEYLNDKSNEKTGNEL